MTNTYLHGYTDIEQKRLLAQAQIAGKYILPFFDFTNCDRILEVGMGVGAQTILLLKKFPHLQITGIEISATQIAQAHKNLAQFPELTNRYEIIQADAKNLDFLATRNIDAAILIWVLEHIPQPEQVLNAIYPILPPGGMIYITEVFNQSLFISPPSPAIMNFWHKSIAFQSFIGGDGNIGIRLGALLAQTGYKHIQVTPCVNFFDQRQPAARREFLIFWRDLMESMVEEMVKFGWVESGEWEAAKQQINSLMENPDTIFYYHSMQAYAQV